MNAYEFGLQCGQLEKEAAGGLGAGATAFGKFMSGAKNLAQRGAKVVRQDAMDAASKVKPPIRPQNALSVPQTPTIRMPSTPKPSLLQRAGDMGAVALDEGLTSLDNLGRVTRHYGGKAVDAVKSRLGGVPEPKGPQMYQQRLRYVNPDERGLIPYAAEGSRALAQGPRNFQFYQPPGRTWGNIGTGAGVGLGATAALTAANPFRDDGTGEPSAQNINAQQTGTQLAMGQHAEANPNSGGLMGMWNSLPIEARYAIGAGVPLALAGAFMGGRGNTGLGAGLGALGLGAAGLGAAGAGLFGDGARRLVGQGANGLYSMFGGGNSGNPMDQINALSQLSPEFGTTMLMGRDPNMNSQQGRQMYDFLTHNRNIIEQLMPQLQNASVTGVKQGSALEFGMKIARCWEGYEPVPGKKPYSNDSCRPVGSKKKTDKKEKKALSSAARGKTDMSCTPSSRGMSKLIDDKQREAASPVPTDATNSQQPEAKAAAFPFEKMDLTAPGKPKPKAKTLPPVKKKVALPLNGDEKVAAPLGALARGLGTAARATSKGFGTAARTVGNVATSGGRMMANNSMQLAQKGMQQGGVRGAVNTALGAAGTAVGGGMNLAGRATSGLGQAAQFAGKRTATAVPAALGIGYGAYQASKPVTQPYVNAAQQFGANVANTAGQQLSRAGQAAAAVPMAIGQGIHNAGSAMGDAVGTAYGNTRNAVVNTANSVRRGMNNAASAAAAVPQAIGQGIHDAGSAVGDAVGTAYGTARNSVVNTANDVRRGVTNAAQTARSYVPGIRNPFYYE